MGTTKKGRGKGEAAEDFSFQVDLKGIIRLLSENLYSSADVFLRELLQMGRFGLLITGNQTGRRY